MNKNEFTREDRYIVIKRKDLEVAPDWLRHEILYALQEARLPERKYVVVESDWPEYEAIWRMIEARMAGHQPEQAEGAQGELHPDLKRVYDVIGLHYSHPVSILIANFENTKRFTELLHAVEREFFMVPGEPSDDPEDEGCEPDDECLMNCWGSTQEQYIEQFRDALAVLQARAALAQPSAAPELEKLRYKAELYDEVWELVTGKGYMNVTTAIAKLEQERDAAQARVAELEQLQGAEVFLTLTGEITQLKAQVAQAGQVPKEVRHAAMELVAYSEGSRSNQIVRCSATLRDWLAAAPAQGGE